MENSQKPLELILARNLITSISTPAFLLDGETRLVFYNEAAGALLGTSFEESGRMEPGQWTSTFGPLDDDGEPIDIDTLQVTQAIQGGRPAHASFCIKSTAGELHSIEASAFPIVANEGGSSGAMILFWPIEGNGKK